MVYFFAFGSLMDLEFVQELGVNFQNAQSGILEGFEFQVSVQDDSDPEYGYANVVSKFNSKVEGVLMAISDNQLPLLDSYEGYPFLYTRQLLPIQTEEGEIVQAWVYLGAKDYVVARNLNLSKVQKERIQNGFVYLSDEYSNSLKLLF